jgi:hypothetical protein
MKELAKKSSIGNVGFVLALIAFLALAGVALAATEASWNVMAGGGGHAETGIYELDGTIGQATTGLASVTGYDLCSGFWCRDWVLYVGYPEETYLPGILKRE